MVAVVQLVEHQVVILAVAGSSPVSHPDAENRSRAVGGRFSGLPERYRRSSTALEFLEILRARRPVYRFSFNTSPLGITTSGGRNPWQRDSV